MIHPVSIIICYVFIVDYTDKHSEDGAQAHEYGNYTEADINQFLIHLYLDVSKMNNEYLEIILDEIGNYKDTVLQKLSKCEVEAWLCCNLMILLPLRFYVKSNLGDFKQSKNVIFCNFRDPEL